jgi:hypothetical protein
MKPLLSIQPTRGVASRFPITDWNYRPLGFGEFNARCGHLRRPSFTAISHDYLNREARHNFVIETLVLALVAVATVPAIFDCCRALLEFMRPIGAM